jgi:GTPase SAR1 family protein
MNGKKKWVDKYPFCLAFGSSDVMFSHNLKTHNMSKVQIKSIFEQIAEKIFTMQDKDVAKQFIIEFVNSKGINEHDKKTIINNVESCKNMLKIQSYICNSLLKYEGMSVNQ